MLSAQYLENCLKEDHVSHGITIQEQRPMKGTFHSRHHSTVLPRLGSSKMESHQNLHTHAVDSAIQLQGNNIVLKKRPPPISDEDNRRQRCTLSQLRLGHCHLLQDYYPMVLGEPSDICTDCGASPQDVRHLFACTTHPTDLSPEDLWRNPVGSIRAFGYLDNGNLDGLEDGPGRGKQQQPDLFSYDHTFVLPFFRIQHNENLHGSSLDYDKIKRDLQDGNERIKGLLLQALRWVTNKMNNINGIVYL